MKRIGVFGGTFNPIHRGHIALASWLVEKNRFDEVWLTLSPANPLKSDRPGASDNDRAEMIRLACEGQHGLRPCMIEFSMDRPSYTISTLRRLKEENPDCSFRLIVGADNWDLFDRWRDPQAILSEFGVTVYPRPLAETEIPEAEGMTFEADAPVYPISSTIIRAGIPESLSLVPDAVRKYIIDNKLYARNDKQTQ